VYSTSDHKTATTLGILAVVFWSTTVAFSRSLTQQLGVLTAACCIYIGAGTVGCLYLLVNPKERRALARIPLRYWLGCGGLFIANIVCFHLAVGLASGGQKIIEVGLINYLWISMTLILSVPILRKKARWGLAPGIVIACAGIMIAALQAGPISWEVFLEDLRGSRLPYVLAFVCALMWALYSNLSRRWGGQTGSGPVPVFLLAAGLVFLVMRFAVSEHTLWSARAGIALGCMILFPTVLAYGFWDIAMRKGAIILVVSVSYLTPLLSTLINCAYLRILPGPGLWAACGLVVGGAVLCRRSVYD
jgi:drug/metabolite transporter (DMT)-like permease